MRLLHIFLFCTFLIALNTAPLFGAEPLDDKSSILIYSDGIIDALVKEAKKGLSEELKKRKISVSSKKEKGLRIVDLNTEIEKVILKREPTLVIISAGLYDIVDPKEETLIPDTSITNLLLKLEEAVKTCQASGIRVSLCTPALYGESPTQYTDINTSLNQLAEGIRTLCEQLEIHCCDMRAQSLKSVEDMRGIGKYKKDRPYLTKDGYQWSKAGIALMAPTLQRSFGVNQSGIGRKLNEDDYIVAFMNFDYHLKTAIEKLGDEAKAQFPQLANGTIKAKTVRLDPKSWSGESPSTEIINQKPTVAFIQTGFNSATSPSLSLKLFPAGCDKLMKVLTGLNNCNVFVLTPPAPAEAKTKQINREGAAYKKSKLVRDLTVAAAEKYGLPVIDIFTITDKMFEKNPNIFFLGRNEKSGITMDQAYIDVVMLEMRKALGLATE